MRIFIIEMQEVMLIEVTYLTLKPNNKLKTTNLQTNQSIKSILSTQSYTYYAL